MKHWIAINMALALASCKSTLPEYCSVEAIDGESPGMVCRPTEHRIEVDCWDGPHGGGEIRLVGDGVVYHRTRVAAGDPLAGSGASCPGVGQ